MTPSPPLHNGSTVAVEYLQHVQAMRRELQTATDAIARNSLAEFEGSLWQQEMISTCMRRNLATLRGAQISDAMLQQIRSAVVALQRDTCTYQGLIGQCSHTTSLLRSLCTLHGHATSSITSELRTLRCEA